MMMDKNTEDNNDSIAADYPTPGWLAFVTMLASVECVEHLVIVRYLRSKSLGQQTLMDKAHLFTFKSNVRVSIWISLVRILSITSFFDQWTFELAIVCGGLSYALFGVLSNSIFLNQAVQSAFVIKPEYIEDFDDENYIYVEWGVNFIWISATIVFLGLGHYPAIVKH